MGLTAHFSLLGATSADDWNQVWTSLNPPLFFPDGRHHSNGHGGTHTPDSRTTAQDGVVDFSIRLQFYLSQDSERCGEFDGVHALM